MSNDVVVATYLIESFYPLQDAAQILAGEQSSGTFVAVPGETRELRERHAARVIAVDELPPRPAPSLPGAARPPEHRGAAVNVGHVRIAFPVDNFGPSLPGLIPAVLGNLFELRELAGVRLLDLDLPEVFARRYPGPQFGVAGTRRLLDAPSGALVGTIIKPSVGLRPEQLRPLVRQLVDSGIDFIKDDELMANPPYSPLSDRVTAVMDEINRGAERTGKKVMYAFNITDEITMLRRHHDTVLKAGGTCVMICVNVIGFPALTYLREHAELPIHGHRAMMGALMRHPALGIEFRAYQKLARLAGVDHLHTSGMNNKFYETNEEVRVSIEAVREPLFGGYEILPVLSSGQWAGVAPITYELIGTTDMLMLAGGGILAHPDGIAAGVASIREGWQAAIDGIALEEYAASHPALRQALGKFAKK